MVRALFLGLLLTLSFCALGSDGTTRAIFEPQSFLEKLAALIPSPRDVAYVATRGRNC